MVRSLMLLGPTKTPILAYSNFRRSKRTFIGITSILGSIWFNESNQLADKMAAGKVHYKNPNVALRSNPWKRADANYTGHVPLYNYERFFMFLGSSIGSFFHPERNEFIVGLGESTAIPSVLNTLRKTMLCDAVGRRILRDRPRITSTSLDLEYLRLLPSNTIGRTYITWLDREGVSPDTRVQVRYIEDPELAYIFQRYRECHDFYHSITGLPIIIEGEIAVKVFEYMNIGIPMSGLGALFAPLRLKPSQKERLYNIYYPWAFNAGLNSKPLINVYWEEILEKDIDEFREEMNIQQPPDLRNLRKQYFEKLKRTKRI